ncbi:dihydropteroate synthase [Echinimonas agarilytica]|uniref:Dihydropteroate synthase n=1 Tax=Echinimonas agarilytica TaxID=1215918 RepID=A0AA41W5X6_9GAMM|nr:dihydropteroate synthase [Echinimonas agarilytica]MCM2679669.1 dihydropteroate synthase [Echinimonas agarilytica]
MSDTTQTKIDFSKIQVMGILNVTPDSFSDGGSFNSIDNALAQAEQMVKDGATIIDIGGESTRPGADDVLEQQELDRVIPVIEAIRANFDIPISIDTVKTKVMLEAVNVGANMINDVMALQAAGAVDVAAQLKVPVCLMHMQGSPRTMQHNPQYDNVIADVEKFLLQRVEACLAAGIPKDLIILDPGFGFGKTLDHNITLLAHTSELLKHDYPILIGLSRKSMFGHLLNRDVSERLAASLAGVMVSVEQGATIFRVHDVRETVDSLRVWKAIKEKQK